MINPEQGFTRTASTTASILSAGVPKVNSKGHKHRKAFEGSIFLGASSVVATPIIRITGILITHSLTETKRQVQYRLLGECDLFVTIGTFYFQKKKKIETAFGYKSK